MASWRFFSYTPQSCAGDLASFPDLPPRLTRVYQPGSAATPRRPLPTVAEVGAATFLEQLAEALGGLPAYLRDPSGLAVVVDSRLLDHLRPDGRERFLGWLDDLITDPEELWLVPMKRTGGRRVVFRQRYLKVYREGRKRHLIFVAEFHRGVMVGFTFFETKDAAYFRRMRVDFLRHAKK